MTTQQIIVFAVLGMTLVLFVWGRWRYDLVACLSLFALIFAGIIETEAAFSGFAHPAVITVAAVLVLSRGLRNSGVVDTLARGVAPFARFHCTHIVALSILVAVASAFMNNVGALALIMPVALESAQKRGRSPATVLMPLAFASILGGMMTMIGTPPNVIIASYRSTVAETPFTLFDFAPVGVPVALIGVFFVSVAGWRLIPRERRGQALPENLFRIEQYITEARVPEGSEWCGRTIGELEKLRDGDVVVAGVIRSKQTRLAPPRSLKLQPEDVLILKADPSELPSVISAAKLELIGGFKAKEETLRSDKIGLMEAVVPPGSALIGRTPLSLKMRSESRTNLLAMARKGRPIRERLRRVKFEAGDVLLLHGEAEQLPETAVSVGLLPLAKRHLRIGKARRPFAALGVFAVALGLAAFGVVPSQISLAAAALVFVLLDFVSPRVVYESIDWSVIVLLGAMIPVGEALQSSGSTALITEFLADVTAPLPVICVLGLVMIVTMTLSDIINNAATAVVMAPLAVGLANNLGLAIDPFLMAVAVGASCAFLTPIGHQCNTLVMGPGGYRFGDYWRPGLPLEAIIVMVSLPLITFFWPL